MLGTGVSLGNITVYLEGGSIVTSSPGHHGKPAPVSPEKPERPRAYPVCRENFKTPVPFQGVVRLLEVHKYLKEDRLPLVHEILYQIGLKGSGTYTTAHQKFVQHIIERDHHNETSVQKSGDRLPKHLYKINPHEVSAIPLEN